MSVSHVYIEHSDETHAPPSRLLKVAYFSGGNVQGTSDYMEPEIFLEIGDFDEGTHHTNFTTDSGRQFVIHPKDLLLALVALGALRVEDGRYDPSGS